MPPRSSSNSLLKSVQAANTVAKLLSSPNNVRRFTGTSKQNIALAVPALTRFIATSVPPPSPAVQLLRDTQYAALKSALYDEQNPSQVWTSYTNLLNSAGFRHLPVEIHQEVLRRCTPPPQEVRVAHARLLINGGQPRVPHLHESKFQTIIRNIRLAGAVPDLDDYHFILSQFAAVGNYPGSMDVYKELRDVGHVPTAWTFGMIFQAIAHRFTLPIHKRNRTYMVKEAREIFDKLMADMRETETAIVPANIDLMFRILKETMDYPAFEQFMRWAYGIDMAYPDRIPLELLERKSVPSVSGKDSTSGHQLPVPFTTHALNTTIDFLGRTGDISKMVQAFEVLTQPLPHAQEHFFSSFEEDEDDVGAVLSSPQPSFTPPSAKPNTTTYMRLVYHAAEARQHHLARHYLNEAMWLNKQVVMSLRHGTWDKPDSEIVQPTFSLNRHIIGPAMKLGNANHSSGMLQWLQRKMPKVIKKKRADLHYHLSRRQFQAKKALLKQALASTSSASDANPLPPPPSPVASSSSSSPSTSASSTTSDAEKPLKDIFDLDFDSTKRPTHIPKPFDSTLHIQILQRDIHELTELKARIDFLAGRTGQRIKERLGRRVWEGKNVYLATAKQRVEVSKEVWAEMVNFKEREEGEEEDLIVKRRKKSKKRLPVVGEGEGVTEFFAKSTPETQQQRLVDERGGLGDRASAPHLRSQSGGES